MGRKELQSTEQPSAEEVWQNRFTESVQNYPTHLVAACAREVAAVAGIDTLAIARNMGTLYSRVFIPETGGELSVEDLDLINIAETTGIPFERLSLLSDVMVGLDLMKSNVRSEQRRQEFSQKPI